MSGPDQDMAEISQEIQQHIAKKIAEGVEEGLKVQNEANAQIGNYFLFFIY